MGEIRAGFLSAIALLFCLGSTVSASCDSLYCSDRGTGILNASGFCSCYCVAPYYGYRCIYSFDSPNNTVQCDDPYFSQSEVYCAAGGQSCYWNATNSSCQARVLIIATGSAPPPVSLPSCFNAFPVPFIATVYAIATLAFGVCLVVVFYFGWYYDVFSRVEETGERVFNQFYNGTSPFIIYATMIVLSAGALAITSWINLNYPYNCAYVPFVYIYLIVQAVPLVVLPLYYLGVWLVRRLRQSAEVLFSVEDYIKPKTHIALSDPFYGQVRCF